MIEEQSALAGDGPARGIEGPGLSPTSPAMPTVDGWDFPVGAPNAVGYYVAAGVAEEDYYERFGAWHTGEDWNDLAMGDYSFEFLAGIGVVSLMAQASVSPSKVDTRAVAQVSSEIGWMLALDSKRTWFFRLSLGVLWFPVSQTYVFHGENLGKIETVAPCSIVQFGYKVL